MKATGRDKHLAKKDNTHVCIEQSLAMMIRETLIIQWSTVHFREAYGRSDNKEPSPFMKPEGSIMFTRVGFLKLLYAYHQWHARHCPMAEGHSKKKSTDKNSPSINAVTQKT
jgi:hypothetical protein